MDYTNEDLAVQIQQGNKNCFVALWENEKMLLYSLCNRFYVNHEQACVRSGVTLEDLQQEAFFALRKAVNSYKPEAGYKLNSYLQFHILNVCNEAIGNRSGKQQPLDIARRFDCPIDESEEFTLADTVPDSEAEKAFETATDRIFNTGFIRVFYSAVGDLPEVQRKAVEMRYIECRTYKQIANALNITISKARTEEFKGVQALRRNRNIRRYNEDVLEGYALRNTGLSAFRSNWASSAELAVERTF